jgi:hypothetical protein
MGYPERIPRSRGLGTLCRVMVKSSPALRRSYRSWMMVLASSLIEEVDVSEFVITWVVQRACSRKLLGLENIYI